MGFKNPLGGIGNQTQILHKNELLFSHWLTYAQSRGLNVFKIAEIRSLLVLEMLKLKNCNTPNTDSKVLKLFLDQNKDSIFLQIDKSKDLAYLDLHDYIHKLISVFSPDKFEKLSRNPLEPDLKLFQAQIRKMEPFLTLSNFRLIKPYHSIKKGHGILKVHKPGMPLRPIINSMFSITSGAEKYILNIIKPIVDQCSFSVPSTMLFTEKFEKFSPKFNRFHEVVGFEAVNIFTSINVQELYSIFWTKFTLHQPNISLKIANVLRMTKFLKKA